MCIATKFRTLLILLCIPTLQSGAKSLTKPSFADNLTFIENKGQITDQYGKYRSDIDYKINGDGTTVFIGDGQLHYQWTKTSKTEATDIYRMDVTLVGCNKQAVATAQEEQVYRENYFISRSNTSAARSYHKVVYTNVYPNIDWVLHINDGKTLEYDFVVHPGGNAADIQLRYDGATTLATNKGALKATTPFGVITEQAPYSYHAATKQAIASSFTLTGNIVRFNTAGVKDNIVIDPTLSWATYYGGSNPETSMLCMDGFGQLCLVGRTTSTTNIATTGAAQNALAGGYDAYLAKFTPSGGLIWATYFGGAGDDAFNSLAGDAVGNVYVGGSTLSSTGIATVGSHQQTIGDALSGDGMLAKFNTAGALSWATYYGGSTLDYINSVTCDATGNVYAAGMTQSTTGIATTGSANGANDGFIAKFSNSGARQWGVYVGGTLADEINSVTLNKAGNLVVAGTTQSTNNIATPVVHQGTPVLNNTDGFLMMYNTTGGVKQWGTYYGGNGDDAIYSVSCDQKDNIYISGMTASNNNIATPGIHQSTNVTGDVVGMLAKFTAAGVRKWGTYYGANGTIIRSVSADTLAVYIAGRTTAANKIALPAGYQASYVGATDAYLASLDSNGIRQYATYYGGTGYDDASSIVFNSSNKHAYLGGTSFSQAGIATTGAFQVTKTNNTTPDAFLADFSFADTTVNINEAMLDSTWCNTDTVSVGFTVSSRFRAGNTFTVQLSDASGSFASPLVIGTKTSSVSDTIKCPLPTSIASGSSYKIRIVSTAPAVTSATIIPTLELWPYPAPAVVSTNSPVCTGQTLTFGASSSTSGITYLWNGPAGFSSPTASNSIPNTNVSATGDYTITVDNHGCAVTNSIYLVVNARPSDPVAGVNNPVCIGGTIHLSANSTAGATYSWVGPGYLSLQQNPDISNALAVMSGSYTVTSTLNNCPALNTGSVLVTVAQGASVAITVSPNDSICTSDVATLTATPTGAGTGPTYQWYKNAAATPGATGTVYPGTGFNDGDYYYVLIQSSICNTPVQSNAIKMSVFPKNTPAATITVTPDTNFKPGQQLEFTATVTQCNGHVDYQWYKDGVAVSGANLGIWKTTLSASATITCKVKCSDMCATPDTAFSKALHMHDVTGITGSSNIIQQVLLYPNPNNGNFVLKAGTINGDIDMEVVNALGQVVLHKAVHTNALNEEITLNNVPDGIYMLRLTTSSGNATIRFSVNK